MQITPTWVGSIPDSEICIGSVICVPCLLTVQCIISGLVLPFQVINTRVKNVKGRYQVACVWRWLDQCIVRFSWLADWHTFARAASHWSLSVGSSPCRRIGKSHTTIITSHAYAWRYPALHVFIWSYWDCCKDPFKISFLTTCTQ